MRLAQSGPWLIADLGREQEVLSFAPHRPGLVRASRIIWREVRNSDLTPDFDAQRWLDESLDAARLAANGACVAMMTSRRIDSYREARRGPVHAVATVGLGNAERIGHRRAHDAASLASAAQDSPRARSYGTINIAVAIDAGLTSPAMIEALTIATQARTAAIIGAGLRLPSGLATGTGTDCIAIAADRGETRYAGLHTALGEAIGRAVHDCVLQGAQDWIDEQILLPPAKPVTPITPTTET
ncbi:adenosylcobinamide amidohydrolase [Paracoccus cavernae]|uniref:adenosylcobinamide amidohydrolase n=2 Tax=Paracoccus cavernae TaxID=1571207 RepID=UPI0035F31F91